jgi:predicted permease
MRSSSDIVQTLFGDLRFGARQLLRNPALTVAALACFALGVGANTSIFSVVNAVLFRPLPYPDSHSLVIVSEGMPKMAADFNQISAPDLIDYRETEGRTFESLALVQSIQVTMTRDGEAERMPAALITPSGFKVLRTNVAIGRNLTEADAQPNAPVVVVLTDAIWRSRYGADRGIIGKNITFANGQTAEVIGVLPPGFAFPLPGLGMAPGDLFFAFTFTQQVMNLRADSFSWVAFGRLKDGIGAARAQASLADIARQLPQRYPESWGKAQKVAGDLLVHVKPMRDVAIGQSRRPLLVLLGAVGFVLLIACINVASLFGARAAARVREITIRKALGATQGRLAAQFLAEALLLLSVGAALGLVFAHWGTRAIVALAPGNFYSSFDVGIDARVLAVTGGLTVLTALAFSVLPNLRGRATEAEQTLRDEGRSSTAARSRQHARRVLIVSEVAFAVILMVGAGLMLRSFAKARAVNPGFDPDNLVTFNVSFSATNYPDADRTKLAELQLLQRLREIPGVQSASATTNLPMQGLWQIAFTPDGAPFGKVPTATNAFALPGFFETMRISLRAGRFFNERDGIGSPRVVIINETMAREYYGNANAVGRRFKQGSPNSPTPWQEIVGVVADVKHRTLDEEPYAAVYQPLLQQDTSAIMSGMYRTVSYVVRTNLPLASLAASVRATVRAVDGRLSVLGTRPMNAIVGQTVAARKFNALLLGLFAALALALAATGVYGVLQYSVVQRTREMGIRLAIGARTSDVIRLIVGQAVLLATIGVGIGLIGAFALTRLIRAMLFDTSPLDLTTFVGSALVLLGIAALSSWLPARRALRIDPMIAMRTE